MSISDTFRRRDLNLILRKVLESDWKFILDVRNEETVRKSCYDTNVISWESHQKYMVKIKNYPQWIIELDGIRIGQCKIIEQELGLMLSDKYQGIGLGTKIYSLIFDECKKLKMPVLKAVIKNEVPRATHTALKVGFVKTHEFTENHIDYSVFEKLI